MMTDARAGEKLERTRHMRAQRRHEFRELIDAEKLHSVMATFYRLTEIGSSLMDLEGNIIVGDYATGWKRICMEFHRKNPETLKKCLESDTTLCSRMLGGEKYALYSCLNGMVDSAVPITLKGEHVANLLSGQYFISAPDVGFFREQARRYGFDEDEYLSALGEVAVLPAERVQEGARFLTDLAEMIGQMALSNREVLETNEQLENRVRERTEELVRANELLQSEIAERRRAEQALRESEAQLNEAQRIAHIGSWTLDPGTGRITYSDEMYRIYGLDPQEDAPPYPDQRKYFHADDWAKVDRAVAETLEKGDRFELELRLLRPDGEPRTILSRARVRRGPDGKPVSLVGTSQDVTEQKRGEQYARSLIEASLDPLVTISPEGKITDVNEATVKVTGVPRDALIGTDFSRYFTEPAKAQEGYRRVFAEGSVTNYPLTIKHVDGRLVDVLYHASVYRDAQGRVLGVFAAARDVTERKRAEAAVAEERQRFNDVFETLPSYIILLTADYRVSYANRVFRERFGESRGRRCYEYLFGRNEPCQTCETYTVMKTGAPHHWEWLGPDGRSYDIYDFPFTERDGSRCILETGIDITERKRAEEEVRQALREKETLLREIHHRVKNNLQVVSSLLDLQSRKIEDDGLRELFQESERRVKSMALVHEKMYQTKSLSAIDFRDYVTTIVRELSSYHGIAERKIATAIDVAPIALSLDLAIPCGLLINELLTNAYRHAFTGREGGEVRIGFREVGGDFSLSVADDGLGLPPAFDWQRSPSLGFQLVTVLVRQLKGAVAVASNGGVAVTITFKRKEARDGDHVPLAVSSGKHSG